MRICPTHWEKLKAAIEARGLSQFVSKDGAEVVRRLVNGSEAGLNAQNFDPLMGAHNAILANTLEAAGLAIMEPGPGGGEPCPICRIQELCQCGAAECRSRYEGWLDHAADDQLQLARELGLVAAA